MNDQLGVLHPLTRILFAGLWCIADREGRLQDRPMRIKAEVLPYDNCDVDSLLNQLHDAGFVTRYEIDGYKYIQINNFSKHQNPHKNEAESVIPPPPGTILEQYSTSTVQAPYKHSTNPADSLNMIPDSLNMIPENPNPVLELDLEPSVGSDLREEKTNIKQEAKERLFNLWNSQGIIEHRQLTPEISKAFDKALKKWDEDAIAEAIKRYGIIYHDTEYFFKHKWGLEKFLAQKNALPDFLDEGDKWQNYQRDQLQVSPPTLRFDSPDSEYYEELRPDGSLVRVYR